MIIIQSNNYSEGAILSFLPLNKSVITTFFQSEVQFCDACLLVFSVLKVCLCGLSLFISRVTVLVGRPLWSRLAYLNS